MIFLHNEGIIHEVLCLVRASNVVTKYGYRMNLVSQSPSRAGVRSVGLKSQIL